jgi:nitrilase
MLAAMKIAALQMVSTPDVDRNLADAVQLIAQAAAAGAKLVALPEYFCLMGRRDEDKLTHAEAEGSGPLQQALAQAARDHGVWLIGGTLPLHAEVPNRVRNTTLVWNPQGQQVARYDKIHLFAFDNGRESYDEGRVLEAGTQAQAFEAEGFRLGLSICYDLRFPEHFRSLMNPPCDVLVVPAAFTYTTGQAHWELLLRARAVENQCYVLAIGQGGQHDNGRRTWGQSMVIDPWGQILAQQAEGPGVVLADISHERIAEVRTQLPALKHRRC